MKYRIVSNGLKFRIQWWGKSYFWQRKKWRFLWRDHPDCRMMAEFSSRDEANKVILTCRLRDEANKRGWEPDTARNTSYKPSPTAG
ncbi:hypothetical protein LCGC14_0357660 [marine sediment metagenome]|uniref:Uncharacterized protein n=1 Tax=marine sediment metagenome TaxID=412755 RepID=A0A0F9VW04_9ZZZZ